MLVRLMIALSFFLSSPRGFATDTDPFTGISPKATSQIETPTKSFSETFFSDNFGFRKELMAEFGTIGPGNSSSRHSIGFESLKKFSTETKTYLAIDIQGRLVWRDGYVATLNDMEGMNNPGWRFEYHNIYADLYDLFGDVGSFNMRVGRFYVPFGLNNQTDTHGTILQLSNERNFGFERDWYFGFWGILSEDFRYDINYLLGSGYDFKFSGQSGMVALRISLANKYSSEYGLEAGFSILNGQRLDQSAIKVNTLRTGFDARYRKSIPTGLLAWTSEISKGRDNSNDVTTQLHQLEYLHASRRWGIATQYRWFWQDVSLASTDSSILTEATWYFSNDVSSSNLHWIKFNNEHQLTRQTGDRNDIWTLQYYRYW